MLAGVTATSIPHTGSTAVSTATGAVCTWVCGVSGADASRQELTDMLGFAYSRHLGFKYTADLLATHARNIETGTIAGHPMVEIKGTRLDGWGRIFKRVFDVIGSLLLIIVTSPIMLAAAIAIKLDSRGPVLFSRLDDGSPVTRVGEHGRPWRDAVGGGLGAGTRRQHVRPGDPARSALDHLGGGCLRGEPRGRDRGHGVHRQGAGGRLLAVAQPVTGRGATQWRAPNTGRATGCAAPGPALRRATMWFQGCA